MKKIIITILCLIVSAISWAQDINIVRNLMNKGRYDEALTIIEGLNVVQNNRYSADIEKIERIKNLYNNALAYYKKDYYSYAITNYEQILKIYSSLSFYVDKSFINSKMSAAKKARAEYLQKQQEKLLVAERERKRQDSIRQAREQAKQARQIWEQTLETNTIEAYERYLNRSPQLIESYKHIALANLRKLYVAKAMKSFENKDWGNAVYFFNSLKARCGKLKSFEQAIYDRSLMERDYNLLSYSPSTCWFEKFLNQFPDSKYSSDVRGRLCFAYCRDKSFDKAYALVQSGKLMTLEGEKKTEAWWNTYIKRQKRIYDKELKKNRRRNRE